MTATKTPDNPSANAVSSKQRMLALAPVVLLSIAIFVASAMPALKPPSIGIEWQDKLFHAVAYFVYGCTIQIAVFGWNITIRTRDAFLLVVLIGIAYGISDEIHQSFVPSRMAEVADAVADTVGVVLSTALLGVTRRFLLRLRFR